MLNYEGLTVWSLDKRQRMDTSRSRAAAQQESPEADRRAFSKALEAVAGSEPICGPRSGAMPLGEPGHINHADCDIAVADFVAHVVVRQSEFDPDKSWDFGLAFRVRDGESQYRLNVESTRHWYLLAGTAAPIATGPLPDLPLEPDTPIAVDLVVHGDSGYFGIDGEFVARLDLALLQNEGPVELVSGLFQENVSTSAKLQYQDFTVIPL